MWATATGGCSTFAFWSVMASTVMSSPLVLHAAQLHRGGGPGRDVPLSPDGPHCSRARRGFLFNGVPDSYAIYAIGFGSYAT